MNITVNYPNGTAYNATADGARNLTDIVNYPPNAAFTASLSNLDVTITDASSDLNKGGSLNDSLTYNWTFGDGNNDTVQSPTHTYSAGTYTITLKVTDNYGLSSTYSSSITVSAAPTTPGGGSGGSGSSGGGLSSIPAFAEQQKSTESFLTTISQPGAAQSVQSNLSKILP